MEPTTIAIAAVAYIALQIAEGGLKEIGKDIYGKVKASLQPEEIIALNLLEKYPKSEEIKIEVAQTLAKRLAEQPSLAGELEELLNKLPAPQVKQNTIDVKGNNNQVYQDISNSTINDK